MKTKSSKRTKARYGEYSSYLPRDPFLRRSALLMICREPGQTFTSGQIADFVGCSRQHIDAIEKSAFRKLRTRLAMAEPQLVSDAFPTYPLPTR